MAKSGKRYADEVRQLRDAGFEFRASDGYVLSDAANWSPSLKASVTRAIRSEDFFETIESDLSEYFDDAAGDDFEEWDDIDWLDFDEAADLIDEETDSYSED